MDLINVAEENDVLYALRSGIGTERVLIMLTRRFAWMFMFGVLLCIVNGGTAVRAADRTRGEEVRWTGRLPALEYRVIVSGVHDGARPTRTSAVRIRYEGRLEDGTPFDASPEEGRIVPLKAMIPGFQAALMQMRVGDVWEVRIPSELAYGPAGPAPVGGRNLLFRISLLEIGELPPQEPPFLPAMPH